MRYDFYEQRIFPFPKLSQKEYNNLQFALCISESKYPNKTQSIGFVVGTIWLSLFSVLYV